MTTKRPTATKRRSPVLPTRKLKDLIRVQLFVRAGGRCEFDGCNKYLLEEALTLTDGNFAQVAHVVAFSSKGPRGGEQRIADINDVANLMLLCPEHHKLIDDQPQKYTREALEQYKKAHENRIRHVTSLGPDRKTVVLVFKALIGGQIVSVPFDHVTEAVAPRYPSTREPRLIDLTNLPKGDRAFYKSGRNAIEDCVKELLRPDGEAAKAGHISIFAIGPMPLLVCLGRELSSKIASDLYQRHRDAETWSWKADGVPAEYAFTQLRTGTSNEVALILSLSGKIRLDELPPSTNEKTVYEITLANLTPAPTVLRQRRDLESFRTVYLEAVSNILLAHGPLKSIDLFPAVPAPIAVLCGRELLPKVHPRLNVFDNDRDAGGWTLKMTI